MPNKVPPTYNLERNYSTDVGFWSHGDCSARCRRRRRRGGPVRQSTAFRAGDGRPAPRRRSASSGGRASTELKRTEGVGEGLSPPREDRLDKGREDGRARGRRGWRVKSEPDDGGVDFRRRSERTRRQNHDALDRGGMTDQDAQHPVVARARRCRQTIGDFPLQHDGGVGERHTCGEELEPGGTGSAPRRYRADCRLPGCGMRSAPAAIISRDRRSAGQLEKVAVDHRHVRDRGTPEVGDEVAIDLARQDRASTAPRAVWSARRGRARFPGRPGRAWARSRR